MTEDEMMEFLLEHVRVAWSKDYDTAQRTWRLQLDVGGIWQNVKEGDTYGCRVP